MNAPDSSSSSKRSRSALISGAYCALTSTSGIGTARKATRPASTDKQICHQQHDAGGDGVVDVVESLVERLPARAEGPAGAREREAPERRAEQGQDRVAHERRPEHARRDRDERPGDGRDPPQEDRRVPPTPEPAFGSVELMRTQVEPAPAPFEKRPAAVHPDRPAEDGADGIADRAGEGHRKERGQT